jgi:hypothetical protein
MRMIELTLQASWIDFYQARIEAIARDNMLNSPTDNKIAALREAAVAFSCSEKEMRNKM